MKLNDRLPVADSGRFQSTQWTVILLAAKSRAPGSADALAELCVDYWYPLYAFVRRRGYGPLDAQDLTQGFFLHLLEGKALIRVDRVKGKFRSFLLASMQNYLSDESDRARALKRGGGNELLPWDVEGAEKRFRLEPVEHLTPEKIYDAKWAMTVLNEAMNRLRRAYVERGKANLFEALRFYLDPTNSGDLPLYETVAAQLQISLGSVKTLIHRLRKEYTTYLREEVGRTVANPAEIDAEIHALCEALVASEGRL